MNLLPIILAFIAGAAIALVAYILINRSILKGKSADIIEKANLEAEKIKNEKILQAKEKFLNLKSEHEQYVNEKNAQIREAESRIRQKENTLNQQTAEVQKKGQQDALARKTEEYDKRIGEANRLLENIAGMTAVEAKNTLMENMKAEARTEAQAYINDTMDEARLNAAKEAKRIVINTIHEKIIAK